MIKITAADFIVRTAYQMGKTPLLPIMALSLGADAAFLGMIVSVSTLTGIGLKPIFGLLSDRWGRWVWLLGGTLLFAGIPFLYQWVEMPEELLLLRFIHGLATAIYGPVTLAWVADQGSGQCAERLGWFGMARNGSYLFGPPVAGTLLTFMDPVTIFTLIGLISTLALIPVLMLNSNQVPSCKPAPWHRQLNEGLKAGLRLPEIWLAGSLECVFYLGVYAMKAFLPLLALTVGIPVFWVGIFFSLQELVHMLLRPLGGRIGDYCGYLPLITSGILMASAALATLPLVNNVMGLLLLSLLFGVAQSLIFPSTVALFANRINQCHTGMGAGLFGSMKNLGKVAGPVLGGWMVYVHDLSWMLWLMSTILAVLSLGLVLLVSGGKPLLQTNN